MILECFEYNQHFVAMMNVINQARRCNLEGKFEKHHIIPRCFYRKKGLEIDNSEENLVNLTFEEHQKVHQLAVLCAKEFIKASLKFADNMMNRKSMIGENNPMFGQNIKDFMTSDAYNNYKANLSKKLKGRKKSNEHKSKISEALTGRKFSNEHKNKLKEVNTGKGNPAFGKHWYNNGVETKFCYKCPDGYVSGRIRK